MAIAAFKLAAKVEPPLNLLGAYISLVLNLETTIDAPKPAEPEQDSSQEDVRNGVRSVLKSVCAPSFTLADVQAVDETGNS
jgi:hypothetical protein